MTIYRPAGHEKTKPNKANFMLKTLEKKWLEEKRFRTDGVNAGKLFIAKDLTAAQQ